MKTPNRRKRVVRDGSAPARRSTFIDTLESESERLLAEHGAEEAEKRRGPFVAANPETDALCAAASADRRLRERIRYEIRSNFASYGLSKVALADLLQSEAESLRHEVEADLRRERGRK